MLNFPPEILGEIFNHYVHGRLKTHQMNEDEAQTSVRRITAYTDSQTHPTDLTPVCRLWRATAISIPRLWATIYVFKPKSEGNLKMFELWLERSAGLNGSCPLDLTIKEAMAPLSITPARELKLLEQILPLAISQLQRWRYISLELSRRSEPFLKQLYNNTTPPPILRGVKISLQNWSRHELRQLMGVLCSAPGLQSITFGRKFCTRFYTELLLDIVPWDRPTTLSFTLLTESMFLRILSASMDTLQDISVSDLTILSNVAVGGSTAVPCTTMRRLQSIYIGGFSEGDAGTIFDKLTLPALRELRLPNGFGDHTEISLQARGWESLSGLLKRSNCKLQIFEFGDDESPGSRFTEEWITKYLKFSPGFEHLTSLRVTSEIGQNSDSLQLLEALSEVCGDVPRPRLLPVLETLILDSVRSVVDVRRMVSDRIAAYGANGRSKLRRVSADLVGEDFAVDMDLTSQSHV
ncbi:hypothetical protein EST38_g5502 [Candolleomyces aberdarensis]|uniref:F-box domain-containing protein n=1 Tax=Candolleomyces aberdarensis TaxID=2316362 RepID=A0A4Q2DKD5_9AGAR|nr:hypothetical protein EST38_g5502 [Candolleomyces aberdarensis]